MVDTKGKDVGSVKPLGDGENIVWFKKDILRMNDNELENFKSEHKLNRIEETSIFDFL
ncbi:hypothetical protein [Staphylococcus gallinarum]|uniref:hypothetical protein n=1 Tax=Staphylococcus gallinarum TaxID=1293 RepID=UPI0024411812|nr:hypothetical protein [Staphylococcus gallinarum]